MATCAIVLALAPASFLKAQAAGAPKRDANVTVRALADREGLVPGEEVTLAVELKPDKDWHVYWISPGGLSGLPTTVEWELPAGFESGRTRYPAPSIKYDPLLKENSYVLTGTPTLLTTVRVPAGAAVGQKVAFKAQVSYLACKKECIPGEAVVTLTLPVVSAGSPPKPANEREFKSARAALPEPIAKAEHVKISHRIDGPRAKPGDAFSVALIADLAAGHHMQARDPAQKELIPTVFYLEPADGLEFGEVAYPKAHERVDKFLGRLREYSGKVELKVPVTVNEDAAAFAPMIRGVLQYQVCNDAGTCFPPQWIEVEIPLGTDSVQVPSASRRSAVAGEGSSATNPLPDGRASESAGAGETPELPDGNAAPGESNQSDGWLNDLQGWFIGKGYYGVLMLALIGGFILNLMPCVLPVISLKILSFVRQAEEHRSRVLLLGIAYCAGIMTFFGLIAVLFAQSGKGWGEHFQEPVVILVLAGLVTAFALSLFGVFSVFPPRVVNKLGEKAEAREGVPSAFFTGVLATVLGTACTAPFLSAAVGAASKYSPQQGAVIFLTVGAGMALPFLVLAVNPAWLRFVPKPGPWMGTFEAVMGFLLLGTVVWLLNPIRGQLGDWGLLLAIIYLLGVGVAVWVRGKVQWGDPPARRFALSALSLTLLALSWLVPFRFVTSMEKLSADQHRQAQLIAFAERVHLTGGAASGGAVQWNAKAWAERDGDIPWVPYDEALVRRFVEAGYTVFVDFTADWCVNCKANLRSSIDVESTRRLMRELGVVPFEADYTSRDPEMKKVFQRHGRASVPMYLVFSPHRPDNPQILPELLTPGIVAEALQNAGASKAGGVGDSEMASARPD